MTASDDIDGDWDAFAAHATSDADMAGFNALLDLRDGAGTVSLAQLARASPWPTVTASTSDISS